ncbi:MAG: hypothetical protein II404_02450 [Prevotella sp.]|nr:hypothetical protein [Prevotella sp.]
MVIDGTKKVSQIQIQPIEAGSVTLSEVIVNAESTKPADPEPEPETPVFTDGKADLSKFEVQDAEKVSYDATTHTITVTEGWTGVQITATSADDVQGKELRITFSEAAKVKASVKYADDTATDSIMSDAAAILYMVIDGTKKVSQIQIQPIEAGSVTLSEVIVNAESTKPADPDNPDDPSQTGVNISLDNLNEGWNSTYDVETKTIDITSDWGARGWYIGDDRYNSKGSVTVKFNAVDFPVTLKMEFTNTADESKSVSAGAATGETEVTVDIPADIKTMEKVYITFEKAGKLVLTEATVNDKVVDNRTEKTLVEKSQAIADGDIAINRGLFSNAVAGDILRIYATGLSEASKVALEPADYSGAIDGANWTAFTESPFELKLTATLLETLKAKNLLVRGEDYTFTKATLYTENDLGEEISDGGDESMEDDISNANASENTKKVYNVLKDLYGKKIVSGVVANIDWNTTEAENVYEWTGKYPAMNVFDYINLHASKDVNSEGWLDYSDITPAKNWWNEGGIVGAMWHWQMKANNGTDYTCTPGTAAGETSFDASKVYVEGTSENTLAKQQLDQLCGYLKKMQDAGIPVVWRPLHEASGNVEQYSGGKAWFWWGAKGADVYKQLWQWMYNYMVKTKGLNNLIWVWTSQTGDKDWYPGDAYVDIIGRDNYGATAAKLATEYEELKEAYPNKMITLSECGNSDTAEMAGLSDIWNAGSRWSWFMTWYDSDYNAGSSTTHKHTSKSWWTNAVAKDYVVTRDQMKELLGQESSDDSQTGVNISLDNLNEGWSSTYDATTKTITTTGEWAARGWYIGDDRYSSKGSITVKYEAVQFGVTLKMEYTNTSGESKSVSAGAAAGETEVELDIPTDVKTIEKVYITFQPIGTLKLTSATVNDKVVDTRTEKTLVEKEAKIADGDIKINRGLFSNAAAKDVIYIYATGLTEASKIALEPGDYSGAIDGANWTAFTESPFALKLTESVLATIKEKGLLVRGENFTFTKATLLTEKDLGEDTDEGNEEPDEPEEPEEPAQTGVNISLDELNEGWSSTYNSSTKTITTEGEWAARGWYIGDDRYNGKGSITVKYEAVTFGVTLKMEYTNTSGESKSVSAGAAAGETEVELDIPADVKTIEKVYITYQPVGKLVLTDATVNDKVVDNRTEKTLVEKSQAIADGDIKINRGLFSNAAAKDVIRIYATGLSDASKIALEPGDYSGAIDGANWTAFTESPFALKLTEAVLTTIKEKGLLVRGENFTFTKATLLTEKELGAEIIDIKTYTLTVNAAEHGSITVKKGETEVEAGTFDEDTELTLTATPDEGYQFVKWQKNGEDAGTDNTLTVKMDADITITAVFEEIPTPIIDEETGEADLEEMAAQDNATTTVTYDEETETITMTTTEAYKAAQIWFNEPEEAKGNVLIVDITEPAVNVTVTVRYTDGTESSMTSTTAGAQRGAKRSAATRRAAEPGTRIAVPVDMGKKVQSIEVKNAEAGTIHITKMAIATRNVFTDGKADLSMAKAQSNATYDVGTYTLATTKGWTGLTITPLATETVKGVELMVKFAANAKVKVAVEYTDGEGPNTIMDSPARYVKMTLDANKSVKEITIQPTEAAIVQFTEVAVNQTATPDELPEPVFTNGKADLSKLTVQDASRVMYNTETYKMATTDGWIGVELNTSEAETVSGAELAVIFTEPAKVKVTVIYNDNTQTEVIADQAQEETRLLLDASKSIKQIQVQPTEAGALQFKAIVVRQTVTPEPEPVYLFNAQGVANLSLFQPMGDNAVYDTAKHQLTTTENWAGIQIWLDNPQAVKGNVLSMKLAEENANVRITVGYTDGTENSADAGDANATEMGTEILVANDATKEIQKVMIQLPEAGIVTLLSISGIEFTVSELAEGESRLLWKNSQGEHLSWNDICRKGEAYGAVLKEDQQLYIAIASRDEDNDWPKVMVRDLNGNTVGKVMELNKIKQFPYVARIDLTADMVEQMADGFTICGDGITVTRIDIYQPYAPQPGDINLKALNGGWNSTYDAKTHTITTTARWAACGWDIGDGRYNDSDLILVKFEAVDFPVTLKMEYTDADGKKQATSAGVAAGSTAVELAIPESLSLIDKVYLIWQKPASLTLTSAEVLKTSQETVTLDLALFEAMGDKVTYDNEAYIMTSQEGYTGIQLWLGDANAIEGGQQMTLTTANEDAKLRLTVGYTDGTEASVDGTGSVLKLELDDLRNIQKVMIQNLEAGVVTLTSLKVTTRVFGEPTIPIKYTGTTDIDTLEQDTDEGEWYNLNGQRTTAPQKGLYIRNGRKVIK